MAISHRLAALGIAMATTLSCGVHYHLPRSVRNDARFGRLRGGGPRPDAAQLCGHWASIMRRRDGYAVRHSSFPELDPERSCFVPVEYGPRGITHGPIPAGCGYPNAAQIGRLDELASGLESIHASTSRHPEITPSHAGETPEQAGPDRRDPSSHLLPCGITTLHRDVALIHNARVLRATADRLREEPDRKYPYAAVIGFGFGWPDQSDSSIADWLPGEACHRLSQRDIDRMGPMILRTRRIAESLRAGVAPLAIVSGGTEHSRMVEAFAMLFLLRCAYGIPQERVLLEPCAEHTHTNIRNAGRWLVAMGARTGFFVTDDGVQRDYLADLSGFEIARGSIDQRALRDWGYLIGSWRNAARGENVGLWYTPYRFWAEPLDGAGSLTCLDADGP